MDFTTQGQTFTLDRTSRHVRQLAFMHIGKTAGTSFHHFLRNIAPEVPTFNGAPEQYDTVSSKELENFGLLLGHFSYVHWSKFRPDRYLVTFLRDPVDRVVSSYYFLHSWQGHVDDKNREMVEIARSQSLCGFLESDNQQVRIVVDNHQTHAMGADWRVFRNLDRDDLLAKAIENLGAVQFLGLTERYEESVELFLRDLGIRESPQIPILNTTANRPELSKISDRDKALIEKYNQLDLALYAGAKKKFELQKNETLNSPVASR